MSNLVSNWPPGTCYLRIVQGGMQTPSPLLHAEFVEVKFRIRKAQLRTQVKFPIQLRPQSFQFGVSSHEAPLHPHSPQPLHAWLVK